MNPFLYLSHVLTVIVATSYVTLGIAAPGKAEAAWAPYAVIVLILAVLNLVGYRRLHGRQS